ncbi:MAG: BamA/TamA family outer membrane protein [bacterium]|nr:BamA/TamA family outer membrane protein [bacterium]
MNPFPASRPRPSRSSSLTVVAILAVLLFAALPAGGQFGKNRIQYRDFTWKIYHSPHFDVYYYEAEEHLLQKAVSFAESAYDELSRTFDYQIQDPTPLMIYQTHSAFQQNNVIIYGVPEGAQAFAVPSRFRMVLPLDMPDRELLSLIQHELTHIFQFHILFRGKLGAGLRGRPPQWFIEGMASYFGDDEGSADKKYMIDAVVNDNIPSVEALGGGFFAYRFGHAVFDFIEERWGKEAVVDLVYEFRNTLGSRIGRAIERTFRMDAEEFDLEFRRWARKKYLPELVATGEPGDFGRPFRLGGEAQGQEFSPAAAPSGDLVAAITTDKGEIDISLFDAENRRRLRNLTKGLETQLREIVVSTNRQVGGDLAFSPDGNYVAAFGRRESGRSLVLIDVLHGGLEKIIDMDIEQQLTPTWSPDGKTIAFSGNLHGHFDIFAIDVETLEITNVTDDELHDAAPAYSPDGKWLAYTSFVGEYAQLFRLDPRDPSRRYQLTEGEFNNKEPVFSPDSRRIYFTSDRTAVDNIFGLDLGKGEITQYTNAVTGCDRPTVLRLPEGGERLVYTGYWKGRFDLYMTDVEEPLGEPVPVEIAAEPAVMGELERFEPDIEVSIDSTSVEPYRGRKFFIEDIVNWFGYDSNNIFVGRVIIRFTDYLGDRRITGSVAAVDTFSDFDFSYVNLSKRWQWQARVFDQRVYALYRTDLSSGYGFVEPGRRAYDRVEIYRMSGAQFSLFYPFSFKNRLELTGGYYLRKYNGYLGAIDTTGAIVPVITPREDNYPEISAALVSDSAIYSPWGAVSGHRLRLFASYAPDLDESGTLTSTIALDARQYFPLTRRSNFAFRFVGAFSSGKFPTARFVGGLDTIRGYRFREFAGNRTFYANAELRFPLIDQLALPGFRLGGIRGVLFFDIGAAWFPEVNEFDFRDDDGRLEDAVAAYGWGFSLRFAGMSANWDFAKLTDLKDSAEYETSFWIGTRF